MAVKAFGQIIDHAINPKDNTGISVTVKITVLGDEIGDLETSTYITEIYDLRAERADFNQVIADAIKTELENQRVTFSETDVVVLIGAKY